MSSGKLAGSALLALSLLALSMSVTGGCAGDSGDDEHGGRPNIILILADDLGYGELGSYGQDKIRTPSLDRLAQRGTRFTQHYSGSPVCAPSRAVLLTGLHTGHAYIRDNDEMPDRGDVWHDLTLEGQRPLPDSVFTLAKLLQEAGYRTGAIGKWGLGGPGSSGEPNRLGFDHWFGYLCQRLAHNYYPPHLWRNGVKVQLANEYFFPHQRLPADADPNDPASYEGYRGRQYSMDLLTEEALRFIEQNQDTTFFLYLPFPVPHVALQVPDSALAEYEGAFPETPYLGDAGYLPHRTPRAAYAAMITRMDQEIGRLLSSLRELKLEERTLIIFTSDNGPTFNGGTDSGYFRSAGPLRGLKATLYEGGIRVPLIAYWLGTVPQGVVSDHSSAFWDLLPTLAEIVGVEPPVPVDGISFLPTLLGHPDAQAEHDHLYWEYQGRQAVRMGKWKAYRANPDGAIELYDLETDVAEQHDVATLHLDVVERAARIMTNGRRESTLFPLLRK
ncbi:MAG: arylsulfatase [Gemmatimonadota bacterium]|nr:MAG: arylsulfatase [Gemmatimonadota bacterium]